MKLTAEETAILEGAEGDGKRLAMRLLVEMGNATGAEDLIPIERAHIACSYYAGRTVIDLLDRFIAGGAAVAVPTTINSGGWTMEEGLPLYGACDPEMQQATAEIQAKLAIVGCDLSWTCAPYQLPQYANLRGSVIADSDSGSVAYLNSVAGARAEKFGHFLDLCAAIIGKAPRVDLFIPERRTASLLIDASAIPAAVFDSDLAYQLLGFVVGRAAERQVPVLVGLPSNTSKDDLRGFGATAAAAGPLKMFHAVGLTPEAATLDAATGAKEIKATVSVSAADLRSARRRLGDSASGERITAVALGTPHASLDELKRIKDQLRERRVNTDSPLYVTVSRAIRAEAATSDLLPSLLESGVRVVTDRCSYYKPGLAGLDGVVMTNSGKWAYYGPASLGAKAVIASTIECVESAVAGRVTLSDWLGSDDA